MAMNDLIFSSLVLIVEFLVTCGVFAVLVFAVRFSYDKIKNISYFKTSRFFNPSEYLPQEEILSIRQVYYLIMIVILVMNILYVAIGWRDSVNLLIFDVIVSIYLAVRVERDSFKNMLILFCLIPFGSLSYLIFSQTALVGIDILHVIAYLYFIKQYYGKFVKYTEDNSLGITIMLLFLMVFISFFVTIIVEDVTPINSLVMVSNAFTSNGYAVLGNTGLGKLNALFLVWAGFILSTVGTATLTVAIVMRHVNEKFDHLEDLVKRNKK